MMPENRESVALTDSNPDKLQELNFRRIRFSLFLQRKAILMHADRIFSERLRWIERAEQARRVASLLPEQDAALAEAYALECDANASVVFRRMLEPIAA